MGTSNHRIWVEKRSNTRVFLALPVSVRWRQYLASYQAAVQVIEDVQHAPIRWTPPENFHITVRFIGSLPTKHIPQLIVHIRETARYTHRFLLPYRRTEIATADDPKMIWAVFQNTPPFRSLVTEYTAVISRFLRAECGGLVMRNGHDVIPHITLARIKGNASGWQLPGSDGIQDSLPVTSVRLYASYTRPAGSVYRMIGGFRLS